MNKESQYQKETIPIVDVIKFHSLPEVVRICKTESNDPEKYWRYYSKIEPDTEVLLQKTQKVKYGHIRILKFYDNEKVQQEKGPEYVLEHDTYVGQEFLIPLKYPGKVRFVLRPGSRNRYITVLQILDDSPRYIKAREETKCLSANDLDQAVYVPARTELEVVRKFINPQDGFTYLECRHGKDSYAFRCTDRVNFKAAEDPKQYNLFELPRFMLPKVILFEKLPFADAILVDQELNSAMLTSMEGPLELLGVQDVELLVGWIRDKESKMYRTVLVPKGAWNKLLVQKRHFEDKADKEGYVARKYRFCENSDFIERHMYFMYLDQTFVTWLRNPDNYSGPEILNARLQQLPIDFPDSSDDENTDDCITHDIPEPAETPPPIPPHKPLQLSAKPRKFIKMKMPDIKSMLQPIRKRTKLEKTISPPARPPKLIQGCPDNISTELLAEPFTIRKQLFKFEKSLRRRSLSMNDLRVYKEHDAHEVLPSTFEQLDDVYDTPDDGHVTSVHNESERMNKNNRNQNRPLPPIPIGGQNITTTTNATPAYGFGKSAKAVHHSQGKITSSDFSQFTVVEVEYCFKMCGLQDFAIKCKEHRLDGTFFENYDFNRLKEEPFSLNGFQILKVKKVIKDGWRPNAQSTDSQ